MTPRTSIAGKFGLLIFSCVITFIVLELAMRLIAGAISFSQSLRNNQFVADNDGIRVLCLGESTTFFGSYKYAYPALLEEKLNSTQSQYNFRIFNEGRIGTNTDAILEDLKDHLAQYRPHYVISMMGVNDEEVSIDEDDTGTPIWMHSRSIQLIRHIVLHVADLWQRPDADHLLESAYDHLSDGDVELAKDKLERARQSGAPPAKVQAVWGQMHWLHEGNFEESIKAYEQALQHDPDLEWLYEDYFQVLYYGLKYPQAAQLMQRMLERFPQGEGGYRNLGKVYLQMKEYVKLKSVIEKAEQEIPNDPVMLRLRAAYHLALGQTDEAERYFDQYAKYEQKNVNSRTAANYKKLRDVVHHAGATLIASQYPLRDVAQLQAMLDNDGSVVYVSNEENFKTVVLQQGYGAVFTDQFAGDFGHLSDKGNRLLADQIAAVLLEIVERGK